MKLKLVYKKQEATGTYSFFFEPQDEVSWEPGQYYYYTLPKLNYPDTRGSTRHLTIASSPTEGNLLMLTTRIREQSGFKKTLNELPLNSIVDGEGPEGTFIFDGKEPGPHIFLAGGIGITLFRCFLKYNIAKKLNSEIYLIFSNSDSEFVFGTELKEFAQDNKNIKIEFFDTSKQGHIDQPKILEILKKWNLDPLKSTWWLTGPPAFVSAMEDLLSQTKVNSSHIRTEKFTGY